MSGIISKIKFGFVLKNALFDHVLHIRCMYKTDRMWGGGKSVLNNITLNIHGRGKRGEAMVIS